MTTTEFFTVETGSQLKADIVAMIKARDEATPRHQQRELGPSEVGHPCMRRLVYGLMQVERCNPSFDPLPAIIGTATHKWLESAAMYANTVLGRKRWHVETRVNITPGLSGSCDLYDADTATVVDYKVPGSSRMAIYKKHGPGETYRTQVHLYGKGFRNAGLPVEQVAIMFIPRGGALTSAHIWGEPYNEAIADEAIARRTKAIALAVDFNLDHHEDRYGWLPKSGPDCMFCPWFSPDPTSGLMCSGVDT